MTEWLGGGTLGKQEPYQLYFGFIYHVIALNIDMQPVANLFGSAVSLKDQDETI